MQNYAVNIENLNKTYRLYNKPSDRVKEALGFGKKQSKTFEALKDVSFNVKKGETVGIIGTNGAGKSTLLKIVTGVLSPTAGNIQIEGKVSALLELGAGFNEEYSGIENIYLNGRMMGYSRKEMDERLNGIVEFAENSHLSPRPASNLPYGVFTRNGSSHASAQFYFYPRLSLIIAKCVKNEKSYLLNSVNIKSGFLSSVMPTLHALINRSNGLPFRSVTFFMSEVPTILST